MVLVLLLVLVLVRFASSLRACVSIEYPIPGGVRRVGGAKLHLVLINSTEILPQNPPIRLLRT
ncbi:MAG: hypothetical protein H7311_09295 [Ramlibacter sp.]|nr:hypothetical protein [Cryobacterium sp.]